MDSSWSVERLEVVGGLVGRQADRQTIVLGNSYVHMCISFTCVFVYTYLYLCVFFVFLRPKPLAGLGLDGLLG